LTPLLSHYTTFRPPPPALKSGSTGFWRRFWRRFEKVGEALVQSQVKFNRVPQTVREKVPEKVCEASVQSQVRFNRVLEKVPEKVPKKVPEKVPGGFGAEPGQVQQGSEEGSGEGCEALVQS